MQDDPIQPTLFDEPIVRLKACTRCKLKKPLSEFYESNMYIKGYKTPRRYPIAECKDCSKLRFRDNWLKAKEKGWPMARKLKKYGLTVERYFAMLEAQGGLCAICGRPEKSLDRRYGTPKDMSVDHAHDESQKVRGLLCNLCNRAIGFFHDDPELLEAAARYLRSHSKA